MWAIHRFRWRPGPCWESECPYSLAECIKLEKIEKFMKRDVAISGNIPYNIIRPFSGRLFFVRCFLCGVTNLVLPCGNDREVSDR